MSTSPQSSTNPEAARSVGRGRTLLLVSAVAFSTAGFFTREAPVDLWAMIFWRNAFGSTALLVAILCVTPRSSLRLRRLGGRAWAVIAASSFATVCYVAAFTHTSVADISIIYGTAPLMTAGAARVWLGERLSRGTVGAACLAVVGAGITVAGSLRSGSAAGDELALAMTVALSIVAVLARGAALPVLSTAILSSLVAAAAVLPLGWATGADLLIGWRDATWLAGFGIASMAVALPCYLLGAAAVPAGEAMLISAIEMPLAPLWVWVGFGEVPSRAALVGGAIVAVAVVFDLARTGWAA
jgi:drug/metabolite transporter (DMT)-like permease